ncbi:POTRA domain-containing protein [Nonlabens xiamenensis]|uniref:POTRA domain-containing protein n=1 Tax=Nonlabens xiamenensis TaxID=2341043 RepID=UPI001F0BCE51|nr:POTRA domain-containing protein [Nonlabens xiamenensis]
MKLLIWGCVLFYKKILIKGCLKALVTGLFLGAGVFCYAQTIIEIEVQENKKTKTSFIKSLLETRTGQPLDSLQLERDVQRLRREPGVSHAYFQVHELEDPAYCKVVFGVQENWTIIPFFNFYTTNEDELAYRLGINEFNALGRGIGIGLFYQNDIFDSYGLDFRAPYLFNKHWGVSLSAHSLTTQEPVFFDNNVAQYRYNNTSFSAGIMYQYNLAHRAEVGFSLFSEDYSYISGAVADQVPQQLKVDKFLVKLIYDYNNIKYYFQYLNGFRSLFNLQYVESQDQSLPSFTIWRNDFFYFQRVGKRGNWANRLRIGFSSNDDSPFAPFAVDNNLNIRGVGNTIDRGTAAIVLNTEYRHTFVDKDWFVFQGNFFVDAGSWRNPGGPLSDFGDQQNLRIYPGIGMRFIHKRIFNTVLRIDYGVGVTPGATRGFVFGIGQYF